MSKVTIAGDANGTGVFTIAAPNGNTNRTLTLPDATGTVLSTATPGVPIGGPAFSAYPNTTQTIASGTFTKVQVGVKVFDTATAYDATTNYRFTPLVAGYYQVTAAWYCSTTSGQVISAIYKNGVVYQATSAQAYNAGNVLGVNSLIYLNGSTDYLEFYVYQAQGSSFVMLAARPDLNYFQAAMVRSAT